MQGLIPDQATPAAMRSGNAPCIPTLALYSALSGTEQGLRRNDRKTCRNT